MYPSVVLSCTVAIVVSVGLEYVGEILLVYIALAHRIDCDAWIDEQHRKRKQEDSKERFTTS